MIEPLVHLNYPLDKLPILAKLTQLKESSVPYSDYRGTADFWKIAKTYDPMFFEIMDDFGIYGKPRVYWLEPNVNLPEHVDNGTTCSLNFILSDDPAPVTIEGKDYTYKQCLLNTSIMHGVKNGDTERILLKISIFDQPYEQVAKLIPEEYLL